MIVPSIDLRGGHAVQLIGGDKQALDAGEPDAIAQRFTVVGEIAVIDLDAALGQGDNQPVIERLVRRYPCRVGGGIRSLERARFWLDAGAQAVIIGTQAKVELLSQLPKDRVIAALDARDGDVVVEGWRKATGVTIEERIAELKDHVGGFLITFVELEGRLGGTSLHRAQKLAALAAPARVTIAGGITTAEEIRELDQLGADAQVGMALYTQRLSLADAFTAPLVSDRTDGLFPTVVADELGTTLGLVYSSHESLTAAIETQSGVYQSRTRGLWEKGKRSGNRQELVQIRVDCDRDALCFVVRQRGDGFCHLNTYSCFGPARGLVALVQTLQARARNPVAGSLTARLLTEPQLLAGKLVEEARELAEAERPDHVAAEAADLIYFATVALTRAGIGLSEVARELDLRALKVSRRAPRAPDGPRTTGNDQGGAE